MIKESINLNSIASVTVNGVETPVINMYASINTDVGVVSITFEVKNKALYVANKTSIDTEKEAFITAVNERLTQNEFITL